MGLGEIGERMKEGGVDALSPDERVEMANLFVKEMKKAEFDPIGAPDLNIVRAFALHVVAGFGATALIVDDMRPLLLRNAAAYQANPSELPVVALILYATWVEHQINVILKTRTVWAGPGDAEATDVIRSTIMRKRIEWLRTKLGLPPFDSEQVERLTTLMNERHEVIHYKWIGRTTTERQELHERIRRVVAEAPLLVEYLQHYEKNELSSAAIALATRVFGVQPTVT